MELEKQASDSETHERSIGATFNFVRKAYAGLTPAESVRILDFLSLGRHCLRKRTQWGPWLRQNAPQPHRADVM
jgi:hypothetical protein